jgi:hypothetical protein
MSVGHINSAHQSDTMHEKPWRKTHQFSTVYIKMEKQNRNLEMHGLLN